MGESAFAHRESRTGTREPKALHGQSLAPTESHVCSKDRSHIAFPEEVNARGTATEATATGEAISSLLPAVLLLWPV
ncbi:hypothetical protein MATL_G00094770 [Megalops atlanticus]|uniref:Uncharacterized protein n=1 Tax=Megalops atlanticus TaxID=7932 RepID=A0A9D3Q5T8_MEGAT|nr:hypothetical protein MATL_G00094770 [Megalops atlanticus]